MPRAVKARLKNISSGTGKRKAPDSDSKRDKGGATAKRQRQSGEGSSSSRDAVRRQSSANCVLNRNCALLDGAPPYSCLAEPCGVCVFLYFCIFLVFFFYFSCILLYFSCIFILFFVCVK